MERPQKKSSEKPVFSEWGIIRFNFRSFIKLIAFNTSSTSSNDYSIMFMQPLTAGDRLSLQLYGVNDPVALQAGTGASLNIVKIS